LKIRLIKNSGNYWSILVGEKELFMKEKKTSPLTNCGGRQERVMKKSERAKGSTPHLQTIKLRTSKSRDSQLRQNKGGKGIVQKREKGVSEEHKQKVTSVWLLSNVLPQKTHESLGRGPLEKKKYPGRPGRGISQEGRGK